MANVREGRHISMFDLMRLMFSTFDVTGDVTMAIATAVYLQWRSIMPEWDHYITRSTRLSIFHWMTNCLYHSWFVFKMSGVLARIVNWMILVSYMCLFRLEYTNDLVSFLDGDISDVTLTVSDRSSSRTQKFGVNVIVNGGFCTTVPTRFEYF